MSPYVRVTESCTACGACLLTCPEHALRPRPPGDSAVAVAPLIVREDLCTGCGECIEVCPADAIEEIHA